MTCLLYFKQWWKNLLFWKMLPCQILYFNSLTLDRGSCLRIEFIMHSCIHESIQLVRSGVQLAAVQAQYIQESHQRVLCYLFLSNFILHLQSFPPNIFFLWKSLPVCTTYYSISFSGLFLADFFQMIIPFKNEHPWWSYFKISSLVTKDSSCLHLPYHCQVPSFSEMSCFPFFFFNNTDPCY